MKELTVDEEVLVSGGLSMGATTVVISCTGDSDDPKDTSGPSCEPDGDDA